MRILSIIFVILFIAVFIPLPWRGLNAAYTPLTSFFLREDVAHVTADYGIQTLGLRYATNTIPYNFGSAGTDGDYQGFTVDDWGRLFIHDRPAASSTPLVDLNVNIDDSPTQATSTVIDVRGFRYCTFAATIQSIGTPTTIKFTAQEVATSAPSTTYDIVTGAWANMIFEDGQFINARGKSLPLPGGLCPKSGFLRYIATGAGTDGSNYFILTNVMNYAQN